MLQFEQKIASLEWSQCPAVENIPGNVSGAWMCKTTHFPVATEFENLEAGAIADQMTEWFDVSREQIDAVLEFAAQSLGPELVLPGMVLDRMTTGAALVAAMQSSPYREIEIYAPGGPMPVREVTI